MQELLTLKAYKGRKLIKAMKLYNVEEMGSAFKLLLDPDVTKFVVEKPRPKKYPKIGFPKVTNYV